VAHACIKISPSPRDLVVEVPSPPELRSPPDKCTCIGPFGGFVLLVFPSSGDVKLLLDCNERKKIQKISYSSTKSRWVSCEVKSSGLASEKFAVN
jgi:hypothetical protein